MVYYGRCDLRRGEPLRSAGWNRNPLNGIQCEGSLGRSFPESPSGFVSQTSSGEPISIAGGSPNAGGRISIDAFRMSLEQWHTVFESGNYALASVTGNSVWQFRSTNPHLFVDVEGSWFSQASEQQFELILRDITLNNVLFDFEGSEFIGGLNESLVFDADPTHVYELAMSTGANFVDLSGPRFSHVMGDVSVSMASAVPEQSSTGWLLALGLSGLLFMGRKHTPQELA